MKKTILATLIAATSFGAMATTPVSTIGESIPVDNAAYKAAITAKVLAGEVDDITFDSGLQTVTIGSTEYKVTTSGLTTNDGDAHPVSFSYVSGTGLKVTVGGTTTDVISDADLTTKFKEAAKGYTPTKTWADLSDAEKTEVKTIIDGRQIDGSHNSGEVYTTHKTDIDAWLLTNNVKDSENLSGAISYRKNKIESEKHSFLVRDVDGNVTAISSGYETGVIAALNSNANNGQTYSIETGVLMVDNGDGTPVAVKPEDIAAAKVVLAEYAQTKAPQPQPPVDVVPVNPTFKNQADQFNNLMEIAGKDAKVEMINGQEYLVFNKDGQEYKVDLSNDEYVSGIKAGAAEYISNLDSHTKAEARSHIRSKIENRGTYSDDVKLDGLNKVLARGEYDVQYVTKNEDGSFLVVDKDGVQTNVNAEQLTELANTAKADIKAHAESKIVDGVIPPHADPVVDPAKAKEAIENLVDSGEALTAYQASQAELYADTYATQDQRITQNEQDINTLFSEVDRLDSKMDSVMAGTHAINNARPYLSGEGKTAVGVGMGYAGSEGSVAVGAAHAFTDSLSASMTVNVTTGSYSEVSGGAGLQYQF